MIQFLSSPREIIKSLWCNQELIYALTKREILSRYQGSALGLFWSFFHPVLMLTVYTFVFSVVFKARWHAGSESKAEFALILFAGLIIFNLFSECINRSPSLILAHTNYVKKVVFPLEILPWVTLGAALFQALMSFVVWLIFYLLLFGLPSITIVLLPFMMLPILCLTMGLSWFLASLGVYLRDINQIVGISTTVLMFLSPIFYPISSLPPHYQYLLRFNPLTPAIENIRDVLFWGHMPNMTFFGVYMMTSMVFAWLGFIWFQKSRQGFADVL